MEMEFLDGIIRSFRPYKGWMISTKDGEKKDPLTCRDEGPLKICSGKHCNQYGQELSIANPGRWHYVYNIKDNDGNDILDRGVREITHYREGYYIVEFNNEDELINRGDVRGGFRCCDYVALYNVVFDDGRLMSNVWFDKVLPASDGFFVVLLDGKYNLIDYSGQPITDTFFEYISSYYGDKAYAWDSGILYKVTEEGKSIEKELAPFNQKGLYGSCCSYFRGKIRIDQESNNTLETLSHLNGTNVIIYDECTGKKTVITSEGYQLFENWYDDISYSDERGRFLVRRGQEWSVIDLKEEKIIEMSFDALIPHCGRYVMAEKNAKYGLIMGRDMVIDCEFDSVMWHFGEMWQLEILYRGKKLNLFHGNGGQIASYAHEVLVSNMDAVFLGKDDVWYYFDGVQSPTPLFRFNPLYNDGICPKHGD